MSMHLLHEIEKLKKRVLTLGAIVEEQVRKSVEAASSATRNSPPRSSPRTWKLTAWKWTSRRTA